MAFSTRRGRPPRPRPESQDYGTPELQFKRALGATQEPIDLCLERGLISTRQHWCGMHLRWLYTLRYGAPVLTVCYADAGRRQAGEDNPAWRSEREAEYAEAIQTLKRNHAYEPTMRLCVFNEVPAFLDPALIVKARATPALAKRLHLGHNQLVQGLSLLERSWRRPGPQPGTCGVNASFY